ncbi:MAG: metal ABC transporter ATP-binding protein [Acidobacteriota bacterium]
MTVTESSRKSAVTVADVSVVRGEATILESITARVPHGGNTAIIGPNGAGKTTLLLALLGQSDYTGEILFSGSPLRPRIGYVPQRFSFDRGLPVTVLEFLVMGLQRRPLWLGVGKKYQERACELLEAVHARGIAGLNLGSLSGGEMQRVLLALALQQDPELLVLDEPSAGVDVKGEKVFCELLEELGRKWGFTQLIVSHDLATVTHHATHVICLNRKVLAEGPPDQVLTTGILKSLFGIHMGVVDSSILSTGKRKSSNLPGDREDKNA